MGKHGTYYWVLIWLCLWYLGINNSQGRIGAEEQVSLQLGLSLTQSFVKLGAGHIIKFFQSYLDNIYQYMTNIFITSWAQLKLKLGFT